MPAQSNPRGSTLDRSRAEPIISNPTNIGNDLGSSTIGVGTEGGLKPKRQPLTRSGGSGGNNSGSQQSLLGFSSRKAGPVTPEKKKKTAFTLGNSLKRKVEQVDAQPEDAVTTGTKTALHPLFAGAKRTNDPAAGADVPVQTIILDADAGSSSTSTAMEIKGISGVPQDGQWDPLLLHSSASGKPTQEMEDNLGPRRKMHKLDLTPAEQVEDAESGRARKVRGLAIRKAMIRADEKIRLIRQRKPSAAAAAKSNTKMTGGGKSKAGGKANGKDKDQAVLDPNDKRWSKIYKESWGVMGGDSIAPIHTTPQSHTKIHHILRVFDLSVEYGPCVGITRLARWERARAWGLQPPEEIREILETYQGADDVSYRETVFEGTGIYCPTD